MAPISWFNPLWASPAEIEGRAEPNSTQALRDHLTSAPFRQQLGVTLNKEIKALNRAPQLDGLQTWRLFRAVRLSALLPNPHQSPETLHAYFHLLLTNEHWYFTATSAWPITPGLPSEYLPSEPVTTPPTFPLPPNAKNFFAQNPHRLFPVTWTPELHPLKVPKGIPIALIFTPQSETLTGELLHAMDKVVRLNPAQLEVRARNPIVNDIITVQLRAERGQPGQSPVTPPSKLLAPNPQIIESRYDLAAISVQCDPGRDSHPFRLGRGRPNPAAPIRHRLPQSRKFMVFPESARYFPISPEDAAYAEAVDFFQQKRTARQFIAQYEASQQTRALDLLNTLVNLGAIAAL